ncbi:MAG: hypothetical protein ACSHX5_06900 [Phycisphaerales bacterium]
MSTEEPNSEPITIEWESDGELFIVMLAWNATRLLKPKNGIPQKIFFAIALAVLMTAAVSVLVMSIPDQDFFMSFLSVGLLYLVYWGFRSIFSTKASAMRWYVDYYRQAIERGDMESTKGSWRCTIDKSSMKFDQLDRQRVTIFPLSDISTLVRVHGCIGLLNGNILMAILPDENQDGVELFDLILKRIESLNLHVDTLHNPERW